MVKGFLHNEGLLKTPGHQQIPLGLTKFVLVDAVKNKAIVYQLDFIGALLQAKVNNRVFVKLESRYTDYFPEYLSCSERDLILL